MGLAGHVCENQFVLVEMLTVHPLCHALAVNFQTFHTACYQKHAAAEDLNGTEHRRGGDSLKLGHPSPAATSFPSAGRDHCSAVMGGGLGGEMASMCLLSVTLSWPTAEVEKSLELTKDSENKKELRWLPTFSTV